jgi:hypothetical protein
MVSFRDPDGALYGQLVPVKLSIQGPAAFGKADLEGSFVGGVWGYWYSAHPFAVGSYTLSGTINGQAVRASITVAGSGQSSLRQASNISFKVEADGLSVALRFGLIAGAKYYRAELYNDDDEFIVAAEGRIPSFTLKPPQALQPGKQYYFYIIAIDSDSFAEFTPANTPLRLNASAIDTDYFKLGDVRSP